LIGCPLHFKNHIRIYFAISEITKQLIAMVNALQISMGVIFLYYTWCSTLNGLKTRSRLQ